MRQCSRCMHTASTIRAALTQRGYPLSVDYE